MSEAGKQLLRVLQVLVLNGGQIDIAAFGVEKSQAGVHCFNDVKIHHQRADSDRGYSSSIVAVDHANVVRILVKKLVHIGGQFDHEADGRRSHIAQLHSQINDLAEFFFPIGLVGQVINAITLAVFAFQCFPY